MLTALFAGATARPSGHRGRRPVPGDLRLARCLGREPGRVPRALPDRLDGTPAQRYVLSVNRRCGSRILAAANQHAAELYEQHPGVIPLEAPRERARGRDHGRAVRDALAGDRVGRRRDRRRAQARRNRRWKDIGILMRTNVDLSAVHEALIARKVPVEVVGLGGLLALPEVVDVVATLQAVNDLTANAAMLRILTGPRYRIGHRDLALLANRSRALADAGDRPAADDLVAALDAAVAGMDSTEVISLAEAVDDPGPVGWGYSAEALTAFPGAVDRAARAARARGRAAARPGPPGDQHDRPRRRADRDPGSRRLRPPRSPRRVPGCRGQLRVDRVGRIARRSARVSGGRGGVRRRPRPRRTE